MTRILILADDLTGAADCAAAFLGRARTVDVLLGFSLPRAQVTSIDLDTRSRPAKAARAIVRRAFASAAARKADILFKKIDSTLRGHVAAEIAAARDVLGHARPVVLAPAFPPQGRTIRKGRLYVNGVAQRGVPRLTMLDARTDGDLDAIARAGLAMRPRPLFVGSSGLARAIARALPRAVAAKRPAIKQRQVVTVVGSASPVSARQVRHLARSRGHDPVFHVEWERADIPRGHYVLTGGATARAVLEAKRIDAFRLLGEVEPGVPFGIARDGTLVCTKAGGFGSIATLARCVARLKREMKKR